MYLDAIYLEDAADAGLAYLVRVGQHSTCVNDKSRALPSMGATFAEVCFRQKKKVLYRCLAAKVGCVSTMLK